MSQTDHIPSRGTVATAPQLSHWLHAAAARSPEACAVETADTKLSYEQLLHRTLALSAQLRERGFVAGDRIGIAAIRSIDTLVAILATIDAGLGYMPLDLNYPADRLQAMLEDATPRVVLGEAAALAQLRQAVGEFPTLENPAASTAPPHAAEADLAYVLFTSGSTGRPKGVAMGDLPLRHLIAWHARHPRLGQPAKVLQFAPLSFDVHFQEIFSTLACGGTLVLVPESQRRDPAQLLAAIKQFSVARLFVPYVALQMLADAAKDGAPGALREVISAGEQLQVTPAIRALFQNLPGSELHNHYGPTESHVCTVHELSGDPSQWPEIPPIGAALPHVELALQNGAPSDDDAPGSLTGELLLGGQTLAHGYLGRAELTAERFRTDIEGLPARWYVTGDLVRRDAHGVCTYLGRADQQLKVDGFRIEPGEIELAMMAHPAIKDAVVTAPELPGVGKQLVAHLVLRDGSADAAALITELRAHLRASLPEYMVPVRFVTLDRLPTTPSGKIDRRGLPLPVLESAATAAAPPLELTRTLWQELLGLPHIDDGQNLFDLGARSLLVMRFIARLKELEVRGVTVADVYDQPTVAGIAAAMAGPGPVTRRVRNTPAQPTAGIAIVGMATRVPGSADVQGFWDQLIAGREGIRHFALSELDPSVPEALRSRSNFVAAHGVLDGVDQFDAAYFGVSAREATMLDPQQRLMLQLCSSALEHAAIDTSRSPARVGVYAGTGNNAYAPVLREAQPDLVRQYGEFATMLASEKDYVATRVANKLNLNGPALSIHTACSTSLVAVAQAWHGLASGQCDLALAGGVNVAVPQISGYLHVEGGMESADGHCRPFDAEASGTVFASGGGAVVLKRLEDAQADGDTIYAVIRGVGLNNDGGDKASFTAPSVTGQAEAIRMALEHAQCDARSIGYVEAHGTGTSLGDPIEVAALTRAWREDTADTEFCGIGSVKSNLGHMAAGAGVVGLIKATLALHEQTIPATLHYRKPNPQIDFSATPFKVVAQNTAWPRGPQVRRAGISSFGVGGTNAHVVIEEAPARTQAAGSPASPRQLLPLSARTAEGALQRARDLADHLERHPDLSLADVAATLMRGRKPMAQRLSVVADSVASAVIALRGAKAAVAALPKPRLVLLFPGQGSQHPGMARQLYDEAPAFREALDRCLAMATPALGVDLHHWLVTADPADAALGQTLAETRYAQPALFSVSYALAAWLDSLGLHADAMIGHSIGEYAAACHAGVFSVNEAMTAVIARGQAMFEQPRGAMLAVRTGVDALQPLLPPGVEIAGCNAPALTVVAGSFEAIAAFATTLDASDIGTTPLKVSHAFHSESMQGALPGVVRALQSAQLKAPAGVVYSCISGAPLQAAEATDPNYWARQVRAPVMFSKAVSAELAQGDTVFVEVGPGQAMTALLRQHRTPAGTVPRHAALLGPAQDPGNPAHQSLTGLGALWCAGVHIGWPVAASAPRLALPTYPFKGERHWFTRQPAVAPAMNAGPSLAAQPAAAIAAAAMPPPIPTSPVVVAMSRIPNLESELKRVMSEVSGLPADEMTSEATFVDQGLDSLSLTQATLELERVFGIKLRFRRLLEDLDNVAKLAQFLDGEMPADKFAPAPAVVATAAAAAAVQPQMPLALQTTSAALAGGSAVHQLLQQQMQLMAQQLAVLSGQPMAWPAAAAAAAHPAAAAPSAAVNTPQAVAASAAGTDSDNTSLTRTALIEKPFGASPRLTLQANKDFSPAQAKWLADFIDRYNGRSGKSKAFSQQHRKVMADPRVVTGFNPLWKDLVYPIVVDRSAGASLWDLDGNEYIDLLSCFGGNLLGYQAPTVIAAMSEQLQLGLEVGPQHPMAAEVAQLISEFTGMERVGFCNTGSEAVMGAMRIARTVTGRKTIAIFNNSYHGIFDEVIVRGTKQLRSLSAAPGILANAVENILVLDWNSEDSLRVLRERGSELAAIMTEPIQNKYPTVQPREFVQALRQIADKAGCALIFDEVVTGFRVAPGGAQEFYGVRADIATYGKVIGGGLPFAAIAGNANWLDALDGGHWQYGDDSYPEAGVTYFAGTFVRHPLALAAARATLLHLKASGRAFYRNLNDRTQRLVDRLNTAFALRGAPVKAVHCASLWRLSWDDNQKFVSLFYFLVRYHGLHLYEQFGHFVTEAMTDAHTDRIFDVFTSALDELTALGLITPKEGSPPPTGSGPKGGGEVPAQAALSPGQTERWLAASLDAHARRALNESLCLSLQGAVDLPSLEAALQDVMARHEAFRICFDIDEPVQALDPVATLQVHPVDLRNESDADAALDRFCMQASLHDFALERAPLARVSLLRLADGRAVVHLVTSHLVFDGWATPVFLDDLAAAYRARSLGVAPKWEPAESPRRFAINEQARWDGPDGAESLAYWKDQFRSPPKPLVLGDRQAPTARLYTGDTLRAQFDGPLFAQLQQLARKHKATLFQLLLAAVSVALQRRTGQPDFVVSIPFASQSLERHGPLIGDGVLDLPLRLAPPIHNGFDAVVSHVRNQLMDALEHPLATQGSVARAASVTSVGNRPPLTGVFFNLNPRLDLRAFEPLVAQVREGRKLGLLSEVVFNFYETPQALTLDLHHSTEFFSPQRAAELVASLRDVLNEVGAEDAAQGTAPAATAARTGLASATALSAHDITRLTQWNATATAYETGLTLGELIRRTVQTQPDAVAVRFEGRDVSYATLDRMAWALAHRLRETGVRPGDLVGVCLDRSVELVAALVGVVYSGAAYVPLDPGYPLDRLSNMCEDAHLRVVVSRQAELARTSKAFPWDVTVVEMNPALMNAAATAGSLTGSTDDPAYVIFTSGSTGRPKGAMNAHKGIVNRLQWMQQEYRLTPSDRVLQKTPYSFDVSVWEFFWPLMTGATIVVAKPDGHRDGDYLGGLIQNEGVTVLHFVPSMLRLFLEEPRAHQCGSLRQVLCSGEALPIDAVDRFFEMLPAVRLGNLYGPTEAAVDVTYWNCVPNDVRRIVPIGRPIANTRMYVLGDQLELLPVGQVGDLYIGGVQVGMGYVSRPELTQERFLADPQQAGERMYKTGDIARWLDDGTIEYLGRSDDQVKLRGNRIELGEIEAVFMKHPRVAQAVVVARDFGAGDTRLVAYLVARGSLPDSAQLKSHLAAELPDYMLPQHLIELPTIPLLPNGKVDRKALPAPSLEPQTARLPTPEPLLARVAPAAQHVPTAAPTTVKAAAAAAETPNREAPNGLASDPAQTIAALMATVLKRPSVGLNDDFFALGGHSLLAARLSARVGESLGWRPGISGVFQSPTPASLARLMPSQAESAVPSSPIVRRADQTGAPLSQMQERLWFMESLHPGRIVYHIECGFHLNGPLDERALEAALHDLTQRQSSLRTVFVDHGDAGVVQQVLPELVLPLFPAQDLSSLAPSQRNERLRERLEELATSPFELRGAPLVRMHMFRLAPNEHALFMMVHHLLFDGQSTTVLMNEWAALYRAQLAGTGAVQAGLPTLTVSYGDFAAWHREWSHGETVLKEVQYWSDKLKDISEPLALPTDLARPLKPSNRAGAVELRVSKARTDRLRALGQTHQASLFMVALAAYGVLLQRHTGQSDHVIGFPVHGRNEPGLDHVVGYFANVLPLRLSIQTDQPFVQVLAHARQAVMDALAHGNVPIEQVVRTLKLPRDESRSPLFQTLFAFQDNRESLGDWGPVRVARMPEVATGVAEDLAVWMAEDDNGLAARLLYAQDLFLPASIELFSQRYAELLDAIAHDPTQRVGELSILTPAERQNLRAWNETEAPLDRSETLATLLSQRMQAHADQPALVFESRTWSTRELHGKSNRLARMLRAKGLGRGSLVGICVERRPEMLVAQLASLWSGVAYVPLDPAYPIDRLQYMAKDAGLALIITDASSRHLWADRAEAVFCLDAEQAALEQLDDSPLANHEVHSARADDPAYVIYTSGSTGQPKGVSVPHGAVVNFLLSMARTPGMTSSDRILAVTTISFDIAVLELLLPLTVGACTVMATREQTGSGNSLLRLLQADGVTMMQATPSTWRMLIAAGWSGASALKVLVGGEALAPDLAQQLIERSGSVWNMYGPTETTVWSTCCQVSDASTPISIGQPIANTQVHVLDADRGPCPVGVPGEIYIGGAGVALGYLNRPELTDERFVADPIAAKPGQRMYRTGDRGRWLASGMLEHLGRLDTQVKIRGHRIELGEIEARLALHSGVAAALAHVREDVPGDMRLVGYFVADGPVAPTSELQRHLKESLPDYMIPQHFVALDAIPLLPNGKTNRAALPAPSTERAPEQAKGGAPRSADETIIAAIWSDVLGVSQIYSNDNFFELGGHSLLAVRALSEMERKLTRSFEMRQLVFESLSSLANSPPNVAKLPAKKPVASGLLGRAISMVTSRLRA